MEQAPSLTMNPSSVPGTPRPEAAAEKKEDTEADTSSLASTSTITPDTPPKDQDGASGDKGSEGQTLPDEPTTPKIGDRDAKSARERAFQHGLDKNNFETEVHQVMGTLNSWWGGMKKQVRCHLSRVRNSACSESGRFRVLS